MCRLSNEIKRVKIVQDPFFEICIEILYFNYNSPITRKNVKFNNSYIQKGQWPEEQRNDTYTFIFILFFYSV